MLVTLNSEDRILGYNRCIVDWIYSHAKMTHYELRKTGKRQTAVLVLFLASFLGVMLAVQGRGTAVAVELTPTTVDYLPYIVKPPLGAPTNTPTPTPEPAPPNTPIPPPPAACTTCAENILNCSDFSAQAEAQACHDYCYALTGEDVHDLDRDQDGVACESLP